MFSRNTRWVWLTLFALVNLICWAGLAAAVGLVVSDRVDLGVETFVRKGQATAVAMWEQAIQGVSQPALMPTEGAQAPPAAQTEVAENRPQAAITRPAPSTALTGPQSQATRETENPLAGTAIPRDITLTPQPEATLVSTPLLLADPKISSLAALDAEMSRSASNRAVQIRYQEEALNREIAVLWTNNPDLPYRDVHVDLQRDGVVITGKALVLGFEVNAEVTGRIVVQDCLPQLEADTISVAGVMTPKFVQDQLDEMILQAMTWYPADHPLCLEQILLEETRATIYGYRR